MSNTNKVNEILGGIKDSLEIVNSAVDLKAQTGKLRNILNANDLDNLIGNCIFAVKRLSKELENTLKQEDEA